jgi:hypothetical protein
MKIAVVMSVGVLLGFGGYLYLQSSDEEALKSLAGSEYVNTVNSDGNDYSAEALSQMAPEKLMDMQKESFNAVINAASDVSEVTAINERPDYISPAEWLMLTSVAKQKKNADEELVRLVNLVRFNKQLELLKKTPSDEERVVLTEAVLNQLPARIQNKEMSVERAQSVQLQLIENLYTNQDDIRARAAKEAQRIGAVFAIEQS